LAYFCYPLLHRGCPKAGSQDSSHPQLSKHRTLGWKPGTRKTVRGCLYANFLFLALLALFLTTFFLHTRFGEWKYNENQALRRLAPISLGTYVGSSSFWCSAFQC
jgi:Domain of unknown function (DUF6766)